jgi:hypothetical protein
VDTRELPAAEYLPLLELLDQAALALEPVAVGVRVLAEVEAPASAPEPAEPAARDHVALEALGGTEAHAASAPERCAYCHDGVDLEADELALCKRCGTVLHEGCWLENARCPTYGCPGVFPAHGGRRRRKRRSVHSH